MNKNNSIQKLSELVDTLARNHNEKELNSIINMLQCQRDILWLERQKIELSKFCDIINNQFNLNAIYKITATYYEGEDIEKYIFIDDNGDGDGSGDSPKIEEIWDYFIANKLNIKDLPIIHTKKYSGYKNICDDDYETILENRIKKLWKKE